MSEHTDLRKGRRHFFIPIKDNNAGKEPSAATVSRWICDTIVESHAAIAKSKSSQDSYSTLGSCSGFLITALQQGESAGCDEGR